MGIVHRNESTRKDLKKSESQSIFISHFDNWSNTFSNEESKEDAHPYSIFYKVR